MEQGIYEQLVTKIISSKLNSLDKNRFIIKHAEIDKVEASSILSQHLASSIKYALSIIKGEKILEHQIEIANKIIRLLASEIKDETFDNDLVETEGKILKAIFSTLDSHYADLDLRLSEITPRSRLTFSELFTGGGNGLTLESELRKEILSSDRIDLLVSFIKWKGVITLDKELREFTNRGGKLRVITTVYMGASDYKAIKHLASLINSEIKISYNTANERLHAKAYMFYRKTGFHTAYIGSSNFSRSALTDGLEWNIKITTKEVSHLLDKFQKTFESYWENNEFELFQPNKDESKLQVALKNNPEGKINWGPNTYFDITPHNYQKEALEQLDTERSIHNNYRNLLVAATGTGKTMISAFDYKSFLQKNKKATLLFIAHKKEILTQALYTFQGVLRDNNFGELWVDGMVPNNYQHVFASVQTLRNSIENIKLGRNHYDFIIIDEVHHITAASYRPIINHFQSKILLGLTATPERMDNANILSDFCNKIAVEIRLPEALNKKLLCPFQYFGISDSIDLSHVSWEKGRYVVSELTALYTSNDRRVAEIISALDKYAKDVHDVRALGFCISIEHAEFMRDKFTLAGFKSAVLTSKNNDERELIKRSLANGEINYLFVVDIFNEGVDIPEIDTLLFLRPTESLTVFLQQLGRGLRLHPGKESLLVLDFVGNARDEYNFERQFRALIGKTTDSVKSNIEANFPHLPLGCSIVLEEKAKDIILRNISLATSPSRSQLVAQIRNFEHQSSLQLTLTNFLRFHNLPLQIIYKRGSWKRLCQLAGKIDDFSSEYEENVVSMIRNKWLSTQSYSYFSFILSIARNSFKVDETTLTEAQRKLLLMLHYDFTQSSTRNLTLTESVQKLGANKVLKDEIVEVLEHLIDRLNFKELEIHLPYVQPLKVHSRYTRDQILVAFGFSTLEKKSSNREGVAENKAINTELLFIDLYKSTEHYSPTTMYEDYAVNETIFHWQSQNQTRNDAGKGLTYINHKETGKHILLFVREKADDQFGNTMGYVFLGKAEIRDHYGSKPMSIHWLLKEPIPPYLWNETAKVQ